MSSGVKIDLNKVPEAESRDFQELAMLYEFKWSQAGAVVSHTECRFLFFIYFVDYERKITANCSDEGFFGSHFNEEVTSLEEAKEWFESLPKLEK